MRRNKARFLIWIFTLFSIFLVLISIQSVSADGGGFTTIVDYEEHIYLPEQKAAIFWDGTHETMVISTKIKSDSFSDKAWVIPIQSSSKPTVDEGNTEIFNDIAEAFAEYDYSASSYSQYDGGVCIITIILFIVVLVSFLILYFTKKLPKDFVLIFLILWIFCFLISGSFFTYYNSGMLGAVESNKVVEVIDFKKVDIYDVFTLKSTNASELVEWLNSNGFYVSNSSIPVIQSYCDQDNYYFVVNKINLTNKYTTESEIEDAISRLKIGMETPLMIRFQPEKPFFPMKMSSINEGETKINVYFISNTRYIDTSGYLTYKDSNYFSSYYSRDIIGGNNYYYDRITWLTYEGYTQDLTGDSYFVQP